MSETNTATHCIPAFIAAQVPPGVIKADGQDHMRNGKGHLVPLAIVSPADKLKDEMVREQIAYALALQAEIARFKVYAFDAAEAFMDLLAQEYGLTSAEGAKGNKTFTTFDQLFKIEIRVADRVTFDQTLLIAKAKIDHCIRRWTTDPKQPANANVLALINYAFEVDKAGKVSPTRIASLRRLAIDDHEWREAMRAIDESRDVQESVEYITFHRRTSTKDKWSLIAIDLAAARLSPEAIAMGGLRAEVNRNEAVFDAIRIELARTNGLPEELTLAEAVKFVIDHAYEMQCKLQDAEADALLDSDADADVPTATKHDLLRQMIERALAMAEVLHADTPTDETDDLTDHLKAAVSALDIIVADAAA